MNDTEPIPSHHAFANEIIRLHGGDEAFYAYLVSALSELFKARDQKIASLARQVRHLGQGDRNI